MDWKWQQFTMIENNNEKKKQTFVWGKQIIKDKDVSKKIKNQARKT